MQESKQLTHSCKHVHARSRKPLVDVNVLHAPPTMMSRRSQANYANAIAMAAAAVGTPPLDTNPLRIPTKHRAASGPAPAAASGAGATVQSGGAALAPHADAAQHQQLASGVVVAGSELSRLRDEWQRVDGLRFVFDLFSPCLVFSQHHSDFPMPAHYKSRDGLRFSVHVCCWKPACRPT